MDYYLKEFDKLEKDFQELLKKYPLFEEQLNNLFDKDIKEINELLEKNDEYYLKKAISKLKDINNYIKDTSIDIDNQYDRFNKLSQKIKNLNIDEYSDIQINKMNNNIKKANELIKSHELKDLYEANKILENLLQ